jgi:hypothetical protein
LISGIGQDGNAAMIFSARASGGRGGCVVDGSDLLGAQPGEGDLVVPLVGGQGSLEAGALPVGQVLGTGAQQVADPIHRVALAASVPVDLLLDPAADLGPAPWSRGRRCGRRAVIAAGANRGRLMEGP